MDLLTTKQMSEVLGIGTGAVLRRLHIKNIEPEMIIGISALFKPEALEAIRKWDKVGRKSRKAPVAE
ncbi:hypothetical protein FACS1894172_12680 [Spirochaetia bacterium]|nr:hypothetical protein FACS1894172_12680 [Spirochaetia bacterium]